MLEIHRDYFHQHWDNQPFVDRSVASRFENMTDEERTEFLLDESRCFVVDQYAAKEFNINEHGTINNDLTALLHPKDFSDLQARLQNYAELVKTPIDEISDAEALRQLVPHGAQTPSEYADAVAYLGMVREAAISAQRFKDESSVSIDDSSSDAGLQPVGDNVSTT